MKIKNFTMTVLGKQAVGSEKVDFIRKFIPNDIQKAEDMKPNDFMVVELSEEPTSGGIATFARKTSKVLSVWKGTPAFDFLSGIMLAEGEQKDYTVSPTDKTRAIINSVLPGALLTGTCEPSYLIDNATGKPITRSERVFADGKISYKKVPSTTTSFNVFFTESDFDDEGFIAAEMEKAKARIEANKVKPAEKPVKLAEVEDLPPDADEVTA